MPQSTSSKALTTSRHTNTSTYGRGRRVTTFTATAPVSTDPHRDLVAAVYGWGRIAVPAVDPAVCAVTWCFDCIVGSVATRDAGVLLHRSAVATVEAIAYNGIDSDLPYEAARRTIEVAVERLDHTDAPDLNEPTGAILRFGSGDYIEFGSAKAVEVAAALNKARVSAQSLAERATTGQDTPGAVSVVRTGTGTLQIGALHDADGPLVFINVLTVLTAADVREVARRESISYPPDSWDLSLDAADQLSAAVTAAAALAAADRAAVKA